MNLKLPAFNFDFLNKIRSSEKNEICEKHGKYCPVEFNGRKSKCPICFSERQKEEEISEELKRMDAERKRKLNAIKTPARFADKTLKNFIADTEGKQIALNSAMAYVRDGVNVLKTGKSMLFIGHPGTGKTHLAIGIAKAFIDIARSEARYITLLEMIETIKDSWRRSGDAEYFIDHFSTVGLLIIDEISSAYNTASERIQFFRIINKRYENMLPTILISNASFNETKEIIGAAAYDRLKEGGGSVVTFNWDSIRK